MLRGWDKTYPSIPMKVLIQGFNFLQDFSTYLLVVFTSVVSGDSEAWTLVVGGRTSLPTGNTKLMKVALPHTVR